MCSLVCVHMYVYYPFHNDRFSSFYVCVLYNPLLFFKIGADSRPDEPNFLFEYFFLLLDNTDMLFVRIPRLIVLIVNVLVGRSWVGNGARGDAYCVEVLFQILSAPRR